jgi:hypothetical protein
MLPYLCILSAYTIIKTLWTARGIDTTKRFLILALILAQPLLNIIYPYFRIGIKAAYIHITSVDEKPTRTMGKFSSLENSSACRGGVVAAT